MVQIKMCVVCVPRKSKECGAYLIYQCSLGDKFYLFVVSSSQLHVTFDRLVFFENGYLSLRST